MSNLAVTKTRAISNHGLGRFARPQRVSDLTCLGTGGVGVMIASNTVRAVVRNGAINGFATGVQCATAAPDCARRKFFPAERLRLKSGYW